MKWKRCGSGKSLCVGGEGEVLSLCGVTSCSPAQRGDQQTQAHTCPKHRGELSQSTQTFHGPVPTVLDLEPWRGHTQRPAAKELILVVHTFTEL